MRKKHTFYSLKVWLTTLLVSPILWFMVIVCADKPSIERGIDVISFIPVYFMLVLFTAVISSVGWFIFWGMEWLAYTYLEDIMRIKWLLFIGVQIIIVSTFAVLFISVGAFNVDLNVLYIVAPYATVAGFSVWYYQLEPGNSPATEPPYDEMADIKQV